ncbi:hypothetical protein GCM10020220_108040 [Nonomuraea rubra]
MFTPMRKMAKPVGRGILAAVLAVTMAPAASAGDKNDGPDHHKFDRGFVDHHDDDDGGRNCRPRTFFRIHQMSPRNFFVPRTRYIDGPGGSMTVAVTREHEVVAFLETENEAEKVIDKDEVIFNLRRLGLPHLEERHMVYSGHEYTQEISDGMYGNMWYRVFGYRVGWSAWNVLGTCERFKVDTGIANVPSRVEGWRYWETKHPMFKRRKLSLK